VTGESFLKERERKRIEELKSFGPRAVARHFLHELWHHTSLLVDKYDLTSEHLTHLHEELKDTKFIDWLREVIASVEEERRLAEEREETYGDELSEWAI